MVLKFTLGKDKDKTIKNDRLAIFLSENLSVKLKAVLLHRFHGIRFKVSEDWLSRDNQFFISTAYTLKNIPQFTVKIPHCL